jgi:chaperonin cofactor prefoldin
LPAGCCGQASRTTPGWRWISISSSLLEGYDEPEILSQLENRIRELEAEVELYKAKMERAKQWLRTLFSQIEERLFG